MDATAICKFVDIVIVASKAFNANLPEASNYRWKAVVTFGIQKTVQKYTVLTLQSWLLLNVEAKTFILASSSAQHVLISRLLFFLNQTRLFGDKSERGERSKRGRNLGSDKKKKKKKISLISNCFRALARKKMGLRSQISQSTFENASRFAIKEILFRFSSKIQTLKTITAAWSNYLTLEMQIKIKLWKTNNLLKMKTFLHFTTGLQSYFQTCIKNYCSVLQN